MGQSERNKQQKGDNIEKTNSIEAANSNSTDDELYQLHNIYKESSVLDDNPMLERKKPTFETTTSSMVLLPSLLYLQTMLYLSSN